MLWFDRNLAFFAHFRAEIDYPFEEQLPLHVKDRLLSLSQGFIPI